MKPTTYKKLLKDLQKLQKKLVTAYADAVRADPALTAWVTERWHAAEVGGHLDTFIDVVARRSSVQLLLRTVYVRVLEDLGVLEPARIRGQWGLAAFKEVAPSLGIRGYLRWVFRDLAKDFPALFTPGPDELPMPGEDLVREIWDLWHREDGKGRLVYDWKSAEGQPADFDSRFLGDLYQDLDKEVRKRFALLQTPVFVEEYILDHTLTPALEEFDPVELREQGETFRLIDPTCGSGHFLIGAFHRLADRWEQHGLGAWEAATRALESVWGADLNPHAVDIARFRLLLELRARTCISSVEELASVKLNVATMDSLIPWERLRNPALFSEAEYAELSQYGALEERRVASEFLDHCFHVVAGNPPYVTAKDPAKADAYRRYWPQAAYAKYVLSFPFFERFFGLGIEGGFIGFITSNSFMTRQSGSSLVEKVIPELDLGVVIDTSSTRIPGHNGVPTCVVLGRSRAVSRDTVVVVASRQGDASMSGSRTSPPSWDELVAQPLTGASWRGRYFSAAECPRSELNTHPWRLVQPSERHVLDAIARLPDRVSSLDSRLGHLSKLIEDDVYTDPPPSVRRDGSCPRTIIYEGRFVRDWAAYPQTAVPFPYEIVEGGLAPLDLPRSSPTFRHFWRFRELLWRRRSRASHFAPLRTIEGARFYEYPFFASETIGVPVVAVAFKTSHNHFAYLPEGGVFHQSSPVLVMNDAPRSAILRALAILGSSVGCFWMYKTFRRTGRAAEEWDDYLQVDGKLTHLPLPNHGGDATRFAEKLYTLARARTSCLPSHVFRSNWDAKSLPELLEAGSSDYHSFTSKMIGAQEELDWSVYNLLGLTDLPVSPEGMSIQGGERPFEVRAARDQAKSPPVSAWWDRHQHAFTTSCPTDLSANESRLFSQRLQEVSRNPSVELLECFTYKRRWKALDWIAEAKFAARQWLLDNLEGMFDGGGPLREPRPYTLEDIVAAWTRDSRVSAAAAVYEGTADVDLTLVAEKLLSAESLPDNPRRLYSASGLRKLAKWKEVWALQDREDAGEDVGTIPKPPEFKKPDFIKQDYYSVRGKLNVPRERFIAFMDLNPTRYGWNGWRDLERGLAQVKAFTEAEGDAYNPLPPPTHEDPRRCGVTLGLWESLDDVRRWSGKEHHGELQALAQEACRQESCPCDLVKRWQKWAKGEIEITAGSTEEVVEATVEDRAFLADLLKNYGATGATARELQRASGWTSQRVQVVLDDLLATGNIGKSGRGARTMYALPDTQLNLL